MDDYINHGHLIRFPDHEIHGISCVGGTNIAIWSNEHALIISNLKFKFVGRRDKMFLMNSKLLQIKHIYIEKTIYFHF